MNTKEEQLTIDIQKRVRAIYTTRQILKPMVLKGTLFLALFTVMLFSVSIKNVLLNLYRIPSSTYVSFFTNAFLHTHTIVQITLVLMTIILVWFAYDLIRKSKQSSFLQSVS
jgi:hypothetical protein